MSTASTNSAGTSADATPRRSPLRLGLIAPFVAPIVALAVEVGIAEPPASSPAREPCEQRLIDACGAPGWVGIHAAEALIVIGRREAAVAAFQSAADSTEPHLRIGIWRVLARAAADAGDRDKYAGRIRGVLIDAHAADRVHALEALAKLNAPMRDTAERQAVDELAQDNAVAPFALWRLAQAGDAAAAQKLIDCLKSADVTERARAATILPHLPASDAAAAALSKALVIEPPTSAAHAWLAAAVGGEPARRLIDDPSPGVRYIGAMWQADHGDAADRSRVDRLLDDADADVCVAAALAAIRIDRRTAAPTTQRKKAESAAIVRP